MVSDFGPPTLFLTFICAEYHFPDITECLKLAKGVDVDAKMNISLMCTQDPMTVFNQFSRKFCAMPKDIIHNGKVFGAVNHYFYKKEYKKRRVLHYHMLLLIRDARVIGNDPSKKCVDFLQNIAASCRPDRETDK